jgi:hypothetical protein
MSDDSFDNMMDSFVIPGPNKDPKKASLEKLARQLENVAALCAEAANVTGECQIIGTTRDIENIGMIIEDRLKIILKEADEPDAN